nr:MAG TPA: hypothetical protein [Bacteriophage sp.]
MKRLLKEDYRGIVERHCYNYPNKFSSMKKKVSLY